MYFRVDRVDGSTCCLPAAQHLEPLQNTCSRNSVKSRSSAMTANCPFPPPFGPGGPLGYREQGVEIKRRMHLVAHEPLCVLVSESSLECWPSLIPLPSDAASGRGARGQGCCDDSEVPGTRDMYARPSQTQHIACPSESHTHAREPRAGSESRPHSHTAQP